MPFYTILMILLSSDCEIFKSDIVSFGKIASSNRYKRNSIDLIRYFEYSTRQHDIRAKKVVCTLFTFIPISNICAKIDKYPPLSKNYTLPRKNTIIFINKKNP